MHWITRLLRHRLVDERDAARLIPEAARARIEAAVAASERHHTGEIRVCIEAGLPWSYIRRDATPRERAVTLFGKLKVWDTEANNGVLIYVLLAEHAFEIVADRGLHQRVEPARWDEIAGAMREAFRQGDFEAGLLRAVSAVDALLVEHFPRGAADDRNELPDAPLML
ncbi:TPM domain-containing protein [Piscinibacter koreensis]|uniref:TPM domain-containing protein n=1 Tax=Piscinibacter koreensis TaxID=2742824 RepID=A0A7Y6NJG8_9BURK|nr:TPM domain-containing protein [Schlegelella koreensis]NUZ04226.1 TPM domain-containing protein [Schlegelella koreensis]